MGIFKPKMYKKNIHEINYKKLKEDGIKCLVFDLDNTLGLISHKNCPDDTKKLIKKLQKDFTVVISSNNTKKRLKPYLEELGIDGVAWSLKPSIRGLIKIKKQYNGKMTDTQRVALTVAAIAGAKSIKDSAKNLRAANQMVRDITNGMGHVPLKEAVGKTALQAGKVAAIAALASTGTNFLSPDELSPQPPGS